VVGDEVVRVDLGLGAGGQLLPAVLPHRGELGSRDGRAVGRREVDLLGGEPGVHFIADRWFHPSMHVSFVTVRHSRPGRRGSWMGG
jgi:hypothetical protein